MNRVIGEFSEDENSKTLEEVVESLLYILLQDEDG